MSSDLPLASSSSSVGSRFVSEDTLKAAQEQRAKDWKAAYERLGQEPPPREEESGEPYDGRSLWEKLQENKNKKQETFDEAMKFKNQFRALDQDEISFLDSITEDNTEEEERKQRAIKEELESFRKAVLTRQAAPPPSSLPGAPQPAAPSPELKSTAPPAPVVKKAQKKQKKTLPGVVVKKKEEKKGVKRVATESEGPSSAPTKGVEEGAEAKKRKVEDVP